MTDYDVYVQKFKVAENGKDAVKFAKDLSKYNVERSIEETFIAEEFI